ncbi:MAG TPA: bifunctional phosphoribosylaminoimidazolecarboxamide formyltransferase/IMP cyclohydrolase [Candidatus Dormibacteraeota bacterium]|nr:bifunctional phosphoribosylaminoimidazolecarboxamide formyltransferase/IMP cyclohydrolase [Candidatus Dormibacteraeota bacterium]
MRALLGVSDKHGLVEFARGLAECGVELIATDGTRRALRAAGIEAMPVSQLTGVGEMLDGRVKTLHPAVHAGILARRDLPAHMQQLADHDYQPIDLVVVSLYPFAETLASGADEDTVVENIDIGGPTMIRAAAKNSDAVAVVVSPAQYQDVLDEIRRDGAVSPSTRHHLAAEAFSHVAAYDAAVASFLRDRAGGDAFPAEYTTGGRLLHRLRYGENPHQSGAVYAIPGALAGLASARRLQGPDLSFTNWLDVDAARALACEFERPAACVIKHTNPCGFAVADTLAAAYERAYEADSRAAFGGIVGVNRPVDEATATLIARTFLEALVCPAIDDAARAVLAAKERLRVLVVERPSCAAQLDVRSIDGGLLVQSTDRVSTNRSTMTVPSKAQPDHEQWQDLLTAWRVCRHVKSNAIVLVKDGVAVGVGAGQMSRVESAELAVARAAVRARGAVAASDAFFPMPDGLETLARAGITAVIHPGGSKKDADVIAAADSLGIAIVHTGERHFRH